MERVNKELEQLEWKEMARRDGSEGGLVSTPSQGAKQPPYHLLLSFQDLACRSKSCLGAIMNPKSLTRGPRDKPTPQDELLPQAIEFVNQYYSSFKE